MRRHVEPTVVVQIFIAGDLARIQRACQAYVDKVGLCVSIEASTYVYTDGAEAGAAIRLVNYPRFPSPEEAIMKRAEDLATQLIEECDQESALVVGPQETVWLTTRATRVEP